MRVTGRRLLVGWLVLVGIESALNYAGNLTKPATKPHELPALYTWSYGVGAVVLYGLVLTIVLVIATGDRDVLGWRRPESWQRALGLATAALVGVYAIILAIDPFLHAGREQGLIPDSWESAHAPAFIANALVIVVVAPFVEETQFRGLGCSALAPYGKWIAIVGVGAAFALSHGLFQAFPELALLGGTLAWLRFKTGSIFPGMLVHGAFNLIGLLSIFH